SALCELHNGHLGKRFRELVEEEAPQRPGVAGVAREERALDRLGEVDEREDRPVEVREMRREERALGVRELLDRSDSRRRHGRLSLDLPAAVTPPLQDHGASTARWVE